MQRVKYQIALYPSQEKRKNARKIHQEISGVGNLEITKDGTNKMREMSKRLN